MPVKIPKPLSLSALTIAVCSFLILSCQPSEGTVYETAQDGKLRLIIETDAGGDPDDEQSLVRFMLYLNEWDVEGIIATRPRTREDNPNPLSDGLAICRSYIDAYREVYPTLRTHAPGYPDPDSVFIRTVAGYNDCDDGVELIIRAVDSPDPRPVWFSNWGTDDLTTSSLKRALDMVLAERGPEGYACFKDKIRLCSDDKFGDHTGKLGPDWKLWVYTKMPNMDGGRWYHRFSPLTATAGGFDIDRDVRTGHGPLGPLYAVTAGKTGEPQKEGDTPEFLYLVPTGMNDVNHPEWGSWAGRFGVRSDGSYHQNPDWYWPNVRDSLEGSFNRDNTLKRWAAHIQNDFKARMDWCVKDYESANHAPSPVLQGDSGVEIVHLPVKAGGDVLLSANGSKDPDGNSLSYLWFEYPEAGSYSGKINLDGIRSEECKCTVPADAVNSTIHVILACSDNGNPPLTRYRRAILKIE
jgi:hypothetical protein